MDERTEQLISRKIDGELTEPESLELDKILIRSPQARAMLEQQERIDALAGETLQAFLDTPTEADATFVPCNPVAFGKRGLRYYLARSAAVAALVGLGVLTATFPTDWSADPSEQNDAPVPNVQEQIAVRSDAAVPDDEWTVPVNAGVMEYRPANQQREILGVYDNEVQRFYLLEINRWPRSEPPVRMNF